MRIDATFPQNKRKTAAVPDTSDEDEAPSKPSEDLCCSGTIVSNRFPAKKARVTKAKKVVADEDDFIVPDGDDDEFDNEPDAVDFSAIDEAELVASVPKK